MTAAVSFRQVSRHFGAVRAVDALRARTPAHIDILALNAKSATQVAPLLEHLGPGTSSVLVGSSGAG